MMPRIPSTGRPNAGSLLYPTMTNTLLRRSDGIALRYLSNPGKKLVHYSATEDAPGYGMSHSISAECPPLAATEPICQSPSRPAWHHCQLVVTTLVKTPGHAPADTLHLRQSSIKSSSRRSCPGRRATGAGAAERSQGAIVPGITLEHHRRRPFPGGETKPAVEIFKPLVIALSRVG